MGEQTLMASLFRHKAWANAELLDAFAAHDDGLPAAERRTAIRILNHAYVVDRIFASHLQGGDHGYAGTNTAETPTLDQLSSAVRETDRWYLDYVAQASPDALAETIGFTFTGLLGPVSGALLGQLSAVAIIANSGRLAHR